MIVTFRKDSNEIIIAEIGFKLVGFHQHRVTFDEIVVEGCLLYHL